MLLSEKLAVAVVDATACQMVWDDPPRFCLCTRHTICDLDMVAK